MIIMFYRLLLVLSVCLTLVYVMTWHKHFDVHVSLIFVLVPISVLGNLLVAESMSYWEALAGNKVNYIGGTFLTLMITLTILNLCHINIPKFVKAAMFCLNMFLYLGVLTIGRKNWFYRSVDFVRSDNLGRLTNKSYGILHDVFIIMVVLYFVIGVSAMVYSYFRKKDVSKRVIMLLFIPEMISFLSFFVGRMITDRIEFLPAAYTAAQVVYLIIIHQVCLYDITDTGIDSLVENGTTGFLSFDFRRRYLGCNEEALRVFPELADVRVDKTIPAESPVSGYANRWLDAFTKDERDNRFHYEQGDKIYLIQVTYLCDGIHKRGYQFFITDDTKSQQYIHLLNDFNQELTEQVEEKTKHITEMHNRLILGMATMVESRDNSTGGHIRRTSEVMRMLTEEIRRDNVLNLSDGMIKNLIKAAPMHDLGKIAVDDQILRFEGRYEPWQFEKMKAHAKEGARIVRSVLEGTDDEAFRQVAENMAHYHHERWDGSGYPEGLKGEAIPIEARIMAVADVYDALVSKRVYKDSMPFDKADSIIMSGMGTQFDPSLERYYVAARPHLEAYYESSRRRDE